MAIRSSSSTINFGKQGDELAPVLFLCSTFRRHSRDPLSKVRISLSCREYSVRLSRMAALPHTVHPELVDAARKREWERVEVRRPLGADFNSECGPLRAVCLGLCQSTHEAVVARRTRPCSAECSPLRQTPFRRLGFRSQALLDAGHDANSRDVYAPLRACALPCERARAKSRKFSPPPSPTIAVFAIV